MLPVTCAMPSQDAQDHTQCDQVQPEGGTTAHVHGQERPPGGLLHGPQVSGTVRPPERDVSESFASRLGLVDDFRFAIIIYGFQTPPLLTSLWISEAVSEDDLIVNLLHDVVAEPEHKVIIPVSPQPRTETVAVIVAEVWNLEQMLVPTLVQVYGRGHFSFVEYFAGRVTHQDVRMCTGNLWPAGAAIYVGESQTPLSEDALINPFPGLLIRVVSPFIIPGWTKP